MSTIGAMGPNEPRKTTTTESTTNSARSSFEAFAAQARADYDGFKAASQEEFEKFAEAVHENFNKQNEATKANGGKIPHGLEKETPASGSSQTSPEKPDEADTTTGGGLSASEEFAAIANRKKAPIQGAPTLSENARTIENSSINLKYEFTVEGDNKYTYKTACPVLRPIINKECIAFKKGISSEKGLRSKVKSDSNGYHFRGITAESYSALMSKIDATANKIAIDTAVYKDLKSRQANGEELNVAELNFMENFLNSLAQYELCLNENGELEDIPTERKSGRK